MTDKWLKLFLNDFIRCFLLLSLFCLLFSIIVYRGRFWNTLFLCAYVGRVLFLWSFCQFICLFLSLFDISLSFLGNNLLFLSFIVSNLFFSGDSLFRSFLGLCYDPLSLYLTGSCALLLESETSFSLNTCGLLLFRNFLRLSCKFFCLQFRCLLLFRNLLRFSNIFGRNSFSF